MDMYLYTLNTINAFIFVNELFVKTLEQNANHAVKEREKGKSC